MLMLAFFFTPPYPGGPGTEEGKKKPGPLENKYQLMLQEKQSKRTYKHPANCRSVTSLAKSHTGSTSTPRTIVFGSLGPFPLHVEEVTPAKK